MCSKARASLCRGIGKRSAQIGGHLSNSGISVDVTKGAMDEYVTILQLIACRS
jgi:hypothetical protein